MKTLTVYYSRSGTTRRIAEELVKKLGSDVDPITEPRGRGGLLGFLRSGYEAATEKLPQINPAGKSPSDYDLVIVGTPVWSKKMSSPVRSYLSQHRDKMSDVAFFCTLGGSGGEATLKAMADLVGKEAKARMMLYQKKIEDGGYSSKVEEFAVELSSAG